MNLFQASFGLATKIGRQGVPNRYTVDTIEEQDENRRNQFIYKIALFWWFFPKGHTRSHSEHGR